MKLDRPTVIVLGLSIFLGLNLVAFLYGAYNLLSQPFQYVNAEPYYQFMATQVSHGIQIYNPLTETAYLTVPYPPVFFLVTGLLVKIFGSSLLIVKVVPLLAGVGCSILVGLIVYQVSKSKVAGLISILILPATQILKFLAPIARVDTLGLFFSLAGVLVALRYSSSRKILWSLPFFVLAVFTKQSLVAAPVAVCLYLLVNKRVHLSILFGCLFATISGGLLLVGNIVTGGQLVQNVFINSGYQVKSIDPGLFFNSLLTLVEYQFPLFVAGIVYTIVNLKKKGLLIIYLGVSFFIFLITVGKPGASWHYGLEIVAICSVMLGLLLAKGLVILGSKVNYRLAFSGMLPVILLFLLSLGFPLLSGYSYANYRVGTSESYREVLSFIKDTNTKVFTEEPIFPLSAGVQWEPWEPATIMIADLENRSWNQSVLVSRFSNGYYEYVLTTVDLEEGFGADPTPWQYFISRCRFTEEMADLILDNYSLVCQTDTLDGIPDGIYVYKYGNWSNGYPINSSIIWCGTVTFGSANSVESVNAKGWKLWSTDLESPIKDIHLLSNGNYLVQSELSVQELDKDGSIIPVTSNLSFCEGSSSETVYSTYSGNFSSYPVLQHLDTGHILVNQDGWLGLLNGFGKIDWSVEVGNVVSPIAQIYWR
jgi:hypothetical protein